MITNKLILFSCSIYGYKHVFNAAFNDFLAFIDICKYEAQS